MKEDMEARKQQASEIIYEDESFVDKLRSLGLNEKGVRQALKDLEKKAISLAEQTSGMSDKKAYEYLAKEIRKLKLEKLKE